MTRLATLRGDSFGQGVHEFSGVENVLVFFLLALLGGLLLLAFAFVRLARRRPDPLPPETEALLEELATPPGPQPVGAPDSRQPPWERDADWWRESSADR